MNRYCIIGAGPAGLASIKAMLDAGHEIDCFEKSDVVGGHWNHDYDALHLITSRQVTGFPEFPMPEHWPLFPHRDHSAVGCDRDTLAGKRERRGAGCLPRRIEPGELVGRRQLPRVAGESQQ